MIDLITNNLKEIRSACRKFDVDTLWVFGSAVRDDWDVSKSDIDFIASFGQSDRSLFRQHMGFIGELQDILAVRVDVVDERSISRASLRDEVDRTRELIYARSHQPVSA